MIPDGKETVIKIIKKAGQDLIDNAEDVANNIKNVAEIILKVNIIAGEHATWEVTKKVNIIEE